MQVFDSCYFCRYFSHLPCVLIDGSHDFHKVYTIQNDEFSIAVYCPVYFKITAFFIIAMIVGISLWIAISYP